MHFNACFCLEVILLCMRSILAFESENTFPSWSVASLCLLYLFPLPHSPHHFKFIRQTMQCRSSSSGEQWKCLFTFRLKSTSHTHTHTHIYKVASHENSSPCQMNILCALVVWKHGKHKHTTSAGSLSLSFSDFSHIYEFSRSWND